MINKNQSWKLQILFALTVFLIVVNILSWDATISLCSFSLALSFSLTLSIFTKFLLFRLFAYINIGIYPIDFFFAASGFLWMRFVQKNLAFTLKTLVCKTNLVQGGGFVIHIHWPHILTVLCCVWLISQYLAFF